MTPAFGDPRLPERFWWKARVNHETGCWEWMASRFANGYGQFTTLTTSLAHRAAYEALVGEIPQGLVSDHLCRVRHCVNPEHLEPVPQRVNILRGDLPSVNVSRSNDEMCRNGLHPWTEDNIYHNTATGKPQCHACLKASYRRYRRRVEARKRGEVTHGRAG